VLPANVNGDGILIEIYVKGPLGRPGMEIRLTKLL
jgi:hypothetical protein